MRLQRLNSGLEVRTEQLYQVPKVRQVRGNQELNEELQVKADELEKLFAAHQLRVSGNQFTLSRRIPVEEVSHAQEELPAELDLNRDIMELRRRLDNSKGVLYGLYMQKRDAKLREEMDSRRFQNEEKMKVMSETLERLSSVMKSSSAGCSDQHRRVLQLQQPGAENLRSFNKQQPIKTIQIQDEYVSDSSEQGTPLLQDTLSGDDSTRTPKSDDSTRTPKSKKLGHSRTFSASIPRSSAPPIPRSSSKGPNVGRRRVVPENPVAQSLPNYSDFKEENVKRSQGSRKEPSRLQFSHIPRSKSIHEQIASAKKDSVWRSQSMKKSSLSYSESKSNAINSATLKKNAESKPFLKKGNGIGPGSGAGIAKLKARLDSENTSSEEESTQVVDKHEDSVSMTKEKEIRTIPSESDIDSSRLRQESERSSIPTAEDIVILQFNSQVQPDLNSEATMPPSTFHTPVRPGQDSQAQSPASWSSRMTSPFSSSHKRLDIDVSMESPMASPASWSSRSVTNVETNSPRPRKKWGITQKPLLLANASDDHSHNVAKGFKRFLNFGRKSRKGEGMTDCISSTTSEGDDETEDGRYPASQSSDDIRKSRMGLSPGPCSYDAFSDDGKFVSKEVQALYSSMPPTPENFKLKNHISSGNSLTAPRSFFSLASFRKGSDMKLR